MNDFIVEEDIIIMCSEPAPDLTLEMAEIAAKECETEYLYTNESSHTLYGCFSAYVSVYNFYSCSAARPVQNSEAGFCSASTTRKNGSSSVERMEPPSGAAISMQSSRSMLPSV